MKSSRPRTALTGVPSSASTSGHAEEGAEVQARGVEDHQPLVTRATVCTRASCHARRRYSSAVEKTDRKILSLLAADGRMSFTDLGKATGLSTSAVHQRVKRLEQRGLIRGYVATVDHDADGPAR